MQGSRRGRRNTMRDIHSPAVAFITLALEAAMKCAYFAALAIFTLAAAKGLAQTPVASPVPPNVQPVAPQTAERATGADSPHDLLIGAGDLLEVSLYGMPDFKTDARVNFEGEITLPMLGSIGVKGLSAEQAEKVIEHKLVEKGLFNNPHIIVFQKE